MKKLNVCGTEYVDVVVIGGGVLGCFVARNLRRWNISVLLMEEKEDVCMGITRANSAIVYSGYDNKPGSRKARMTVKANAEFEDLCRELDVPFVRCGSLAAAFGPKGEQVLKEKYEQGLKNGVPDLQLISGKEAREIEPHLTKDVTMALYAPTTGTVNPWKLGIAAFENARQNGCQVWLNTRVTGLEKREQGYLVECKGMNASIVPTGLTPEADRLGNESENPENSKHSGDGLKRVACRVVINCAGLFSDQIQELLFPPSIRLFPDGAGFLVLDRSVSGPEHIVFQETEEEGKGITAIPAVEGNLLLASPKRNQQGELFSTDDKVMGVMKQMASTVLPQVDFGNVIRSFGAVRPNPHRVVEMESVQGLQKWTRDGKSIGSFSIEHPAPGFYSLIGIKTPGLTCANELGNYLAEQTAEYLHAAPNPDFNPRRRGITSVHQMNFEERSALVAEHPEYGAIICQCEDVSRGEIVEAIRRGAVTADGVKRRVGSGMGRCQGGRCSLKIEKILQEFRN